MGDFKKSGFSGRGGGFGGKKQFNDRRGGGKPSFGRDREERQLFKATCDTCGKACEVPFQPNGSRPVLCSDCFKPSRDTHHASSRGDGRDQRSSFRGRESGKTTESSAFQIDKLKKQLDKMEEKIDSLLTMFNVPSTFSKISSDDLKATLKKVVKDEAKELKASKEKKEKTIKAKAEKSTVSKTTGKKAPKKKVTKKETKSTKKK